MLKYTNKLTILVASLLSASLLLSPLAEASSYIVQKGDNLTKIAKKHKVTVAQLKQWNNLSSDIVYSKQKLVVISPVSQKSSKSAQLKTTTVVPSTQVEKLTSPILTSVSVKNNTILHTVTKGEALSIIAKQYNVEVAHIKQLNNLTSDLIFVGQTLKVSTNMEVLEAEKVTIASPPTSNETQGNSHQQTTVEIDLSIAKQLAQEKAIKGSPLADGQTIYNKIVALVPSLIDVPYLFGGSSPTTGFDCSGFVHYVYTSAGVAIARESSEDHFIKATTTVTEPIPGDVVFFKNTYKAGISHMGIYLGDGQFVHAGSEGVEISKLEYKYWQERFVAFKRFNQFIES